MKRWSYTFHICASEDIAREFCERAMRGVSAYVKKKYPAHYTPWNEPGYPDHFVAWTPCYTMR